MYPCEAQCGRLTHHGNGRRFCPECSAARKNAAKLAWRRRRSEARRAARSARPAKLTAAEAMAGVVELRRARLAVEESRAALLALLSG